MATLCSLWGYSFPDQVSNPGPQQWKHGALTIEPPGNSLWFFFFNGWRRSYHIALLFNQSLFLDMLNYFLCFTIINSKQISRSRTFELKYLYMVRFRICTANCTQPTTSTFHYTFTWKSLYTLIRNAYFQHLPSWSVTCFSVLPISLVIKEGCLFLFYIFNCFLCIPFYLRYLSFLMIVLLWKNKH